MNGNKGRFFVCPRKNEEQWATWWAGVKLRVTYRVAIQVIGKDDTSEE